MIRHYHFYTARPANYRDFALFHKARVEAAGGEGVDLDALTLYYQLKGQYLLQPRACFLVEAGYRLDDNGLVEYLFDPEGADLAQPDPGLRAAIGQNVNGKPVLVFTGNQYYAAVDTSYYQLGTGDLIHYLTFCEQNSPSDFTIYNMDGLYYLVHFKGAQTTVIGFSAPDGTRNNFYSGRGLAANPGVQLSFQSFVLRQLGRSRFMGSEEYGNELDPITNNSGNPDAHRTGNYIMGYGYAGQLRTLLNLKTSPGQTGNHSIWEWLQARA